MRRLAIALAISLALGCSTSTRYVFPALPDPSFRRPERPVLETVAEDVPEGAQRNTARLMSYARQMEA